MIDHITPGVDALMMKTPEEIKRGLEYLSIRDIVHKMDMWKEGIAYDYAEDAAADALAYIQQLEQDNARKDERILQLEMINAEYKHVLGYIKHAADMGVHGDADVLAQFGINMGRGVEEDDE